jgi:hypothetical protein
MRRHVFSLVFTAFFVAAGIGGQVQAKNEPPEVTPDGLHRVTDSKVALAYVAEGADFSQYKRVMILDCEVAFKKNWRRSHNRGSMHKVSSRDMQKIRDGLSEAFREVFVHELEGNGGYAIVEEADEDVLLIRPAIVNLDVAQPNGMQPGAYTLSESAGEMSLYLELYDSTTGALLAKAFDAQAARERHNMQWQTRGGNRVAAKRILGEWSQLLRVRLDEVHGKTAK